MGTGTGANATFAQLHYCACGAGELLEKEASQQDFLIFGQTALIFFYFFFLLYTSLEVFNLGSKDLL